MKHTRYKIRLICPHPFKVDRPPQLIVDQKMCLKIDHIFSKIRGIIQERLENETTTP